MKPTVKQLIKFLEKLPQDAQVRILSAGGFGCDSFAEWENIDLNPPTEDVVIIDGIVHIGNRSL